MIMLLFTSVALVVSMLATSWLLGGGRERVSLLDQPGERSLHAVPTPRSGGIAIALGLLPALVFVFSAADVDTRMSIVGWLLVFGISLIDDWRGLPFWVRLPVHLLAAACVVFAPGYAADPWLVVFGVFWIAWGTNLFNFMDGMDGLAGMMAVVGGTALGFALLVGDQVLLAMLLFGAVAASAGFLVFNFPPARIFMGDAGSAPLGFLFAAFAVQGVETGAFPGWVPLLIFLPFIADATFTLLRRAWKRRPVWKAHREHAYQVLVLAGWPVKKVLVAETLAMVLCASAALVFHRMALPGWQLLAAGICMFLLVYSGIIKRYST